MASYIINNKWDTDKKSNFNDECEIIVTAADKLIWAQAREMDIDEIANAYSSSCEFEDRLRA